MDCAEGSYGQIYDHFQTKDKISEALRKLRVVFITHIHGDHQLGIIKIMSEREKLFTAPDLNDKLYVVIPTPMLDYIDSVRTTCLKYPEMVVIVPSDELNPED
jgi:ribonuclease Z